MERRKRFSIVTAGTAAILGVSMMVAGVAPFGGGASGAVPCPVGISFDASNLISPDVPPTVLYGQGRSIAFYGQLVPEVGADVASKTLSIQRINGGTSTPIDTITATTNGSGHFNASYTPTYSALYAVTWAGTTDCAGKSSSENAFVAVTMGIATSKVSPAAGTVFEIRGSVRPNKAGKVVTIFWALAGPRYPTFSSAKVTLDAHSNFSKSFVSYRHGVTYLFRAGYRAQDMLNEGGGTSFVFVHIV